MRIKVVTENGVVYLMGLMTRNEADAAVERSREVFGVKKIVKVFEYID
jgi:osmotically-inducible protein OsmY